jgi:hypothetical protein
MKILSAYTTLVAGHTKQSLQCLHDCCLSRTVRAYECGQARTEIDCDWSVAKRPKISQDETFNEHGSDYTRSMAPDARK